MHHSKNTFETKKEIAMSGPKPPEITLTPSVRRDLSSLIRRHSASQQKVKRARIVLLTSEGKNNAEIAREVAVSLGMVRYWRQRWLYLEPIAWDDLNVDERLTDLPRPGAPSRLTTNQICQIEQMACEQPEESGVPISHWTGREIAEELIRRGIVKKISVRHASRLLKKGALNPI